MSPKRTIKARAHHGATSLDLTIPAEVCRSCELKAGDVFSVSAECGPKGDVVIRYRRVHKPEP